MSPQRPPVPAVIGQKVQLTHKLFLLEKARDALERELRAFTDQAYEDVQRFLNSSFPTSAFNELSSALDVKCRAVDGLTSALREPQAQPAATADGERGNRGRPTADGVEFGPAPHNVLTGSSGANAAQAQGATPSLRQLDQSLASQSGMCSDSSGHDPAIHTTGAEAGGEERAVTFAEKRHEDDVILPPAVTPSAGTEAGATHAEFPRASNPKPVKAEPLSGWAKEAHAVVQPQKQTSSQLLRFLRAKAQSAGAREAAAPACGGGGGRATRTHQLGRAATADVQDAPPLTAACADFASEAAVFKVKRVASSGLTYSCVIATKTELWDVADVLTEAAPPDADRSPLGRAAGIRAGVPCPATSAEASASGGSATHIPEFQIKRFEEAEVVVSHVVSPGCFYVQRADGVAKLQGLITGSRKATRSCASQNSIPDIGTQVMAWFPEQEQWCRAQVTKICGVSAGLNATDGAGREPSIDIEVKRLDFGDTARLSLLDIAELSPDMAALPLQCVQVSLANVTPVNGTDWSEEAVGWFKHMVHNRTLYARIYPQGPRVTVELFMEKGKLGAMRRGASLSLRLAQNGHAKHSKLKSVGQSAGQRKTRERCSDWEKYLISCYTQQEKHKFL